MAYNKDFITYLCKLREEGLTWAEVRKAVKDTYGITRSAKCLRATHHYYMKAELEDVNSVEDFLVAQAANSKRLLYKKQSLVNNLQNITASQSAFKKELMSMAIEMPKAIPPIKVVHCKHKRNAILEIMLTDLHIGLKCEGNFSYKIAEERMKNLCEVIIKEVERAKEVYNIKKLLLNCLGDLIHNEMLHPVDSLRASEGPNPQQSVEATRIIYMFLIVPLNALGIHLDFNCLAGNHDRIDVKRPNTMVGETSWAFMVYSSLEMLVEVSKAKNITFNIAKDSFLMVKVFKDNMLLTHGDDLKGTNVQTVEAYIHARSKQLDAKIDYLRIGHFHEYKMYGRGRFIVSDSFCGTDHYARRQGYNSPAGQVINYYVETKERPTSFYKSFPIYLR